MNVCADVRLEFENFGQVACPLVFDNAPHALGHLSPRSGHLARHLGRSRTPIVVPELVAPSSVASAGSAGLAAAASVGSAAAASAGSAAAWASLVAWVSLAPSAPILNTAACLVAASLPCLTAE